MPRIAYARLPAIEASAIGGVLAARPQVALDADAALVVAPVVDEAIVLGAFQRARSTIDLDRTTLPIARRTTGGGALHVREGQLYVALDLARPDLLGGVADVNRAINRHVRPLLRALSSVAKVPATYGGRLTVSMAGEPIAWIGVGHERASGRTFLESIVAVERSFVVDPALDLAGRAANREASLAVANGTPVEVSRVERALVESYVGDHEAFESALTIGAPPAADIDAQPFAAMIEEAIGLLGAVVEGDRCVVGGELMASTDALVELAIALKRPAADVAATIDAALRPSHGTLCFGVRSLGSIEKVVRAALDAQKSDAREA